jgi:hypothetical protein
VSVVATLIFERFISNRQTNGFPPRRGSSVHGAAIGAARRRAPALGRHREAECAGPLDAPRGDGAAPLEAKMTDIPLDEGQCSLVVTCDSSACLRPGRGARSRRQRQCWQRQCRIWNEAKLGQRLDDTTRNAPAVRTYDDDAPRAAATFGIAPEGRSLQRIAEGQIAAPLSAAVRANLRSVRTVHRPMPAIVGGPRRRFTTRHCGPLRTGSPPLAATAPLEQDAHPAYSMM